MTNQTPPPISVKSVKLMYFKKNLLLYSGVRFRQTNCIVMMIMEGSTKILNFMTPVARAWPSKSL